MHKFFLILLALICCSQIANAAPIVRTVSMRGDLAQGRTITISGLNFGTKPAAAPVDWEDWESYDNIENPDIDIEVVTDGEWELDWNPLAGDIPPYLTRNSDFNRYPNNTVLRKMNSRPVHDLMAPTDNYTLANRHILISVWLRYMRMYSPNDCDEEITSSILCGETNTPELNPYYPCCKDSLPQIKMFTLMHDMINGNNCYPSILYEVGWKQNWFYHADYGIPASAAYPYYDGLSACPGQGIRNLTTPPLTRNAWHRVMMIFDKGDPCTTNGRIINTIRGAGVTPISQTTGLPITSVGSLGKYSYYEDGSDYSSFTISGWIGNTPESQAYTNDIFWDDIYIDNTWCRVEIGNNPIYEQCTELELQIPTTWSNTSITVTANPGALLYNATASRPLYLFVIDENNTASAGYRIYPTFIRKPHIESIVTERE